ncbi:MAG: T9SS type A sorting domain-containing protein [Saprospiraceae bacterium]|nr:T9SS type A sorting domain-containing protein [Saprospiraceae bacterium]
MKTFLLSLCFFALTLGQSFAQKKLSAGVQHYGRHLAPPLGNIMERAGFDLGGGHFSQAKNNILQLDSTKTFFSYDPTGSLDSLPLQRTVYQYPETGARVEMEDQYEDGAWTPVSRTLYTSDNLGRLVDVVAQYYDAETGSYVSDSRIRIFPHGTSAELIDSFFIYGWNPDISDFEPVVANINVFDENDRLMEIYSTFDLFGEPVVFRDVLHYDAAGDNVLTESFAVFEGAELLMRITETEYLNHLPIEAIESAFAGVGFEPVGRNTYAYTNFGALRQQSAFDVDFEIGEWMLTERVTYEYDDTERISALETEAYQEEEAVFTRVVYDYIQDSDLALETTYFRFNMANDWNLETREYFYYNIVSSVPEAPRSLPALKVAPNPTMNIVQIQIEGDALVQIFDATGRLRRSLNFQAGQLIDLADLPAGVYYLTAKNKSHVYSSKVVKL